MSEPRETKFELSPGPEQVRWMLQMPFKLEDMPRYEGRKFMLLKQSEHEWELKLEGAEP